MHFAVDIGDVNNDCFLRDISSWRSSRQYCLQFSKAGRAHYPVSKLPL